MKRIGKTPEFGIENAQEGIFISSMEFTPSFETYEQEDHVGEVQGLMIYKQKIEFSMGGEVEFESTTHYGVGTEIALANALPAGMWLDGVEPAATTTVVTGAPYSRSRGSAQEIDVSGTIYPFGDTSSAG